ncbi:hypothetical protein [Effusibacillus pohliae]|uniref:hypothetical protein n=1 Tax=Effusibacillus pohliae TaxID=232270 RepID=UPI00036932DD|nr:hypothetical protein [Effusibacillus pohliae]
MQTERYVIGLGYGGSLQAMGRFEWDFRCSLGLRDPQDVGGREAFLNDFAAATSPEAPVVLVLDDYNPALFRTFMEQGKQAIRKSPDLYVFVVAEDQSADPPVQYFLNIESDPVGESLLPHQMILDAEGVPDGVLLFLQDRLGVRFYRRDEELMMEFRIDELPLV